MTTRAEVRDTRDPRTWERGRDAIIDVEQLRVFLQDVLHVPANARRFSVTFAVGEAVVVSVEYLPQRGFPEEAP